MFVVINDILEPCLPNVERATLKGASHSLEMENPGDFNEMVLGFLSKNAFFDSNGVQIHSRDQG